MDPAVVDVIKPGVHPVDGKPERITYENYEGLK